MKYTVYLEPSAPLCMLCEVKLTPEKNHRQPGCSFVLGSPWPSNTNRVLHTNPHKKAHDIDTGNQGGTGNWSRATDVPPSFEHVLRYLRLVGVIYLACFLRLPTRKCFRGSSARQDEPRHAEQDAGVRICSQCFTTCVVP